MKSIPKDFKVSESFFSGEVPSIVKKTMELLDRLPKKELVTTFQLARLVSVSRDTIRNHATNPSLAPYRYKHVSGVLWGGKKTIVELRARMERE